MIRKYTVVKGNIDGGISKDLLHYFLRDLERTVQKYGYAHISLELGNDKPKAKPKHRTKTDKVISAITGYKTREEMNKTERKTKDTLRTILG